MTDGHRTGPDRQAVVVLVTTTDSAEAAQRLADGLVRERLAACAQVDGPVRSTYRWAGEARTDTEWRCSAKTTADLADAATSWLLEHHGDDLPEVVALPVIGGSHDYLAWVAEQTRPR